MNVIHHTIDIAGAQTDDAAVVGVKATNHSTGKTSPVYDGTSKRATGDPRNDGLGEAIAVYRALKALVADWEEGIHLMAGGHCEGVGDPRDEVSVKVSNAEAAQAAINAAVAVANSARPVRGLLGREMGSQQTVDTDALDALEDALE